MQCILFVWHFAKFFFLNQYLCELQKFAWLWAFLQHLDNYNMEKGGNTHCGKVLCSVVTITIILSVLISEDQLSCSKHFESRNHIIFIIQTLNCIIKSIQQLQQRQLEIVLKFSSSHSHSLRKEFVSAWDSRIPSCLSFLCLLPDAQ